MKKYFENQLNTIKNNNLFRKLKSIESAQTTEIIVEGKKILNFSSNNYLDLTKNKEIIKAKQKATEKWGTGAGASRLISGNLACYDELEKNIASFKSRESGLVYTCGFMANTGIISAISDEGHALIIDRLNHASIIDGTKLSKARRFVYKHKNMDSLEKTLKRCHNYKYKLVITDTVFSMDGDIAPLKDITYLCGKYDAGLIVDEAHAFGVFGKNGQGMMNELGLQGKALIDMGTFSKAAGGLGGYVCTDRIIRDYLINTSRSLIYTTGLPPGIIMGNVKAVEVIQKSGGQRQHLKNLSEYLRSELKNRGFDTGESETQIIPVILGDNETVIALQDYLMENGVYAPGIRFPTVPKGSARLRVSLTSGHTEKHVDTLISLIEFFNKEKK